VLPGDGVLRAAYRWLRLLERSSLPQASALIRADATYTDLSPTQYAAALDWLRTVRLLQSSDGGARLAPAALGLTDTGVRQLLFGRSLEAAAPAWLPDADALVRDPSELPQDAADLAAVLGVDDPAALLAVRQVHGRIDLAQRARVGAEGEKGLIALLERRWPGSTKHVALTDDGLGYDLVFTMAGRTWHLEVKTTSRRGRLVLYLSRHEHEVALLDPDWRLVVVGLDAQSAPAALATARHQLLQGRAPHDHDQAARWESARHQLLPSDLQPGLAFLGQPELRNTASLLYRGYRGLADPFMWMPLDGPRPGP
jgi:hypothetical protein